MNIVEQSYVERKQVRHGGIYLLKKIINLRTEALTDALQVTKLIDDICRIIWNYVGINIFFSDEFRLVVWHQCLSEKYAQQNIGGFEILEIPENSLMCLNFESDCCREKYLDVITDDKNKRGKLFPFSAFPYAYGSDVCCCDDISHDLELQFLHDEKWHHVWDDYNESAYPAIDEDKIEWISGEIGYSRYYRIIKSKENLFVNNIRLSIQSLLENDEKVKSTKIIVSLLNP